MPTSSKSPKATKSLLTVIILVAVAILLLFGAKEPKVLVFDNHIQINGMYGVKIDFAEISDITLIDRSMREIGVGRRIGGYKSSFGETLKGNFESSSTGKTLLFVQSKTAPTIKIDRIDKKDVYISFKNSEYTKQVFNELRTAFMNVE